MRQSVAQHGDGAPAGRQGAPMRGGVHAPRQPAHHREARGGQVAGHPAGHPPAVVSGPPRAHQRQRQPVLRPVVPFHAQQGRRVLLQVPQRRRVVIREERHQARGEPLHQIEFPFHVRWRGPIAQRAGQVPADAAQGGQPLDGRLQSRPCRAEVVHQREHQPVAHALAQRELQQGKNFLFMFAHRYLWSRDGRARRAEHSIGDTPRRAQRARRPRWTARPVSGKLWEPRTVRFPTRCVDGGRPDRSELPWLCCGRLAGAVGAGQVLRIRRPGPAGRMLLRGGRQRLLPAGALQSGDRGYFDG